MARHAQITQNNKFAIFLQYLKKEISNEVDFLHADKHESLLQMGGGLTFSKLMEVVGGGLGVSEWLVARKGVGVRQNGGRGVSRNGGLSCYIEVFLEIPDDVA